MDPNWWQNLFGDGGGVGLFGYGGTFNGDNLWLPSVPMVFPQTQPNIEAQNPYATPPILAGGSSGISGYSDASIGDYGGGGDFNRDFDMRSYER